MRLAALETRKSLFRRIGTDLQEIFTFRIYQSRSFMSIRDNLVSRRKMPLQVIPAEGEIQ